MLDPSFAGATGLIGAGGGGDGPSACRLVAAFGSDCSTTGRLADCTANVARKRDPDTCFLIPLRLPVDATQRLSRAKFPSRTHPRSFSVQG